MAIIFFSENFKSIFGSFLKSFRRFPLTLLCSLVATICVILIAKDEVHSIVLEKIAATFGLFLPMFFGAEIFEERKQTPRFLILGLSILAIITFYFFGFPFSFVFQLTISKLAKWKIKPQHRNKIYFYSIL